jgi:hypothetical protein
MMNSVEDRWVGQAATMVKAGKVLDFALKAHWKQL